MSDHCNFWLFGKNALQVTISANDPQDLYGIVRDTVKDDVIHQEHTPQFRSYVTLKLTDERETRNMLAPSSKRLYEAILKERLRQHLHLHFFLESSQRPPPSLGWLEP